MLDRPARPVSAPGPGLASLLAMLVGATAIGLSPIFMRFTDVGPSAIGFWRMLFALPVMIGWFWRDAGKGRTAAAGSNWPAMLGAGVSFALEMYLFALAVDLTTVAKAALLSKTGLLMVVAVGVLFQGHRPRPLVLAALALAVLGMAILVKPEQMTRGDLAGDLIGVGAAVAYAAYLMAAQRARRTCPASWVSLVSTAIGAAVCLPAALLLGEHIMPSSTGGWLAVIALGLVSHAFGQGLIAVGLGKLAPTLVAMVLIYPAAVSILAAYALFGEQPTALDAFGGVLILVALVMARKG